VEVLGLAAGDRAALEVAAQAAGPGAAPPPAVAVPHAAVALATTAPLGVLPAGTVTFLFTDLEGSTKLLQAHPAAYREAVARHHALLRGAVETHGGAVFETVGDAVYAAFASPAAAVAAALAGQLALQREPWGEVGELRARMGLHTGEVELQGRHYFGAPLYRCARLTATAHGGQVVLSEATSALVQDELPGGRLRDLGEHRLRDLARPERVIQLVHPDLPGEFPPLRSSAVRVQDLPAQPTQFVGREREVAAVRERLHHPATRLLTLTGPGGTGKTRLALRAADLPAAFPDGVWFVSLAPLSDPDLVPAAVARAVAVQETGDRGATERLKEFLRGKRALLVLDNCEHLLAAGPWVAELLAACPPIKVLATSRAPLRLAAEVEFPVPPLSTPDPARLPGREELSRYDAVALFVQRARAVRPDFALTDETAPAVAALCRRLDGLPLALELAAARVKALPPGILLARLGSRLALLTGGARDLPPRHQTLRAAIDWSYRLLTGDEQTLFRRLAVFAGGCTLDAAEAVCAPAGGAADAVLDGIAALVDKSLLRRLEAAGEARLALLETVREYALEALDASADAAAVRRRHADFYLHLAEAAEPALFGPGQADWLRRLDAEHDNLRAALGWLTETQASDDGLRLAGALWVYWWMRGHFEEGRTRLAALLAEAGPTAPAAVRARALRGVGGLAAAQGNLGAAGAAYEESLALSREAGDPAGVAWALVLLGNLARYRGDYARAHGQYEESLALRRALADRRGVAHASMYLGTVLCARGETAQAGALLQESLDLYRALGDAWGTASALTTLGEWALATGDPSAARRHFVRAREQLLGLGELQGAAAAAGGIGDAALIEDDLDGAGAAFVESLSLYHSLRHLAGVADRLESLAAVAATAGRVEHALRLAGAAAALRDVTGAAATPLHRAITAPRIARAREALGATQAQHQWEEGRVMDYGMAVDEAVGGAASDTATGGAAAPPVADP
jgi:predicted ATPase/class 3 adenylate cyclase